MRAHALRAVSVSTLLLGCALAQCPSGSTLLPGDRTPSPAGPVFAMVAWDPDGPGPLGQHLVCGGEFQYAGLAAAANVALFDPATRTWSALGAGFDGPVRALAVSSTGALVAGGSFAQSGAIAVARVALWSGSAWAPVGTGTDGDVHAAVFTPNGDLFVGGSFATAGGAAAANFARWNGTAWSGVGSGVGGVPPYPVPPSAVVPVTWLAARSNGDVVVAGAFTQAGGLAVHGIARWNGAWSALGAGPLGVVPTALTVLANDDVVLGTDDFQGNFQAQRWNGTAWTSLGTAWTMPWMAFCEQPNGQLLAHRLDGFTALADMQRWNGTAWLPAPSPFLYGRASALFATGSNDVWISGAPWGLSTPSVMHFDGQVWRAPADGRDGEVVGVVPFGDGFAMGGLFRQVGGVAIEGVAVRQNGVWSQLGAPIDGQVYALLALRNGGLLVGGGFTVAAAPGSQDIARWDGQQWHAIGTPPGAVQALAEAADGALYCGGGVPPFVAGWNGTNWLPVGALPTNGWDVSALAVLPDGDVVAGLRYATGALVQRWDGIGWLPLGNGLVPGTPFEEITALCVLPNGDLVAGGTFQSGSLRYIARWNGNAWQPMGLGLPSAVRDLDLLPNGDLLATHDPITDLGQPVPAPSVWDGSTWTPVPGIAATLGRGVRRSAVADRGEVLFTGDFETANGAIAGGLASLRTNCPTNRQPAGPGCTGSAGPVTSTIVAEAWLGGIWRARATNLPAAAVAVHVFGLGSVALPLANVLPMALPGCTLHVSPDLLLLDLPVGGASDTNWSIPRVPSLLAQTFRHQVVPIELGPGLALTAVTASNAWAMTIGAW